MTKSRTAKTSARKADGNVAAARQPHADLKAAPEAVEDAWTVSDAEDFMNALVAENRQALRGLAKL